MSFASTSCFGLWLRRTRTRHKLPQLLSPVCFPLGLPIIPGAGCFRSAPCSVGVSRFYPSFPLASFPGFHISWCLWSMDCELAPNQLWCQRDGLCAISRGPVLVRSLLCHDCPAQVPQCVLFPAQDKPRTRPLSCHQPLGCQEAALPKAWLALLPGHVFLPTRNGMSWSL